MAPAVRASRTLAERLLDPDFVEVGASGRRWTREAMLADLPDMAGSADGPQYVPIDMMGTELAPGLVQLTYETAIDGRRARRSSIWRKLDESSGWRMYYHQATPVPSAGDGRSSDGALSDQ